MISDDPGDLILPQVDRSHSSAAQQPVQCDESLTAGKMLRQEGGFLRQAERAHNRLRLPIGGVPGFHAFSNKLRN